MNSSTNKYTREDAYKALELTNSWINNVDTKASFGLAFIVALLAIVFYNAGTMPRAFEMLFKTKEEANTLCCVIFSAILVSCLYLTCLSAIISFFFAIRGRIKNQNIKNSMFFFGSIATMSLNEFKARTMGMNDKDLIKDILEQVHTNSCICKIKFKFYNIGLGLLVLSVILFFLCMTLNLI